MHLKLQWTKSKSHQIACSERILKLASSVANLFLVHLVEIELYRSLCQLRVAEKRSLFVATIQTLGQSGENRLSQTCPIPPLATMDSHNVSPQERLLQILDGILWSLFT